MALIVEIDEKKLNPNDVIVYRGDKWRVQSKAQFLADLQRELGSTNDCLATANETIEQHRLLLAQYNEEMEELKANLAKFADGVNQKLKEHHDVLSVLVGGDK